MNPKDLHKRSIRSPFWTAILICGLLRITALVTPRSPFKTKLGSILEYHVVCLSAALERRTLKEVVYLLGVIQSSVKQCKLAERVIGLLLLALRLHRAPSRHVSRNYKPAVSMYMLAERTTITIQIERPVLHVVIFDRRFTSPS